MSGSDSDDECGGDTLFGKLFLNEAYVECALSFGGDDAADAADAAAGVVAAPPPRTRRTLRIAVSAAACTDHDLTGQLTWPGARLLARWLAAQPDAFFRESGAALELGAGTGLAGLYYAARGGDVTLTDYHPVVMALLRRNAGAAAASVDEAAADAAAAAAAASAPQTPPPPPLPPAGRVSVARLPWGVAAAGAKLLATTPNAARGFRCLLGADILYPGSQRALPGLMASVCQLLSVDAGADASASASSAALYLCYCSRAVTTDVALRDALVAAGLVAVIAPGGEAAQEGGVSGVVYRITRRDAAGGEDAEAEEAAAAAMQRC
jgi:hypothetical protein